jgi:DNA/RNA non-specific endonuclease
MDYQRWWRDSHGPADFGRRLCDAWTSQYLAASGTDLADLVVVDPGNGFSYLFDLAGSLSGGAADGHAPRVVGVWGLSRPGGSGRDHSRMRGHPRPGRRDDDRGHLISCAAGGGYDINLVPMDAALNRGRSRAGARFRALETKAAAVPGTLFFIRPVYRDGTDRPATFEAGAQDGEELLTGRFDNNAGPATPMPMAALRQAAPFRLPRGLVEDCLGPAPTDALFARGWRHGLARLTRAERCAVAGVTGHVAESVTEILLDRLGWHVLWHFTGPGRHGVDLVFLAPGDLVVAVEVKGTLVAGRIPRLSRGELTQMSASWMDKADNPGMSELGLGSADICGAVMIINFTDLTWRASLTTDFSALIPITNMEQLTDPGWLQSADQPR